MSVAVTALALFGWSIAPGVNWLFVCALPLGLGGGSVDAALNNFVASHYASKHMNWLHCFWGVGATAGPAIMALILAQHGGWRAGYTTIATEATMGLWTSSYLVAAFDFTGAEAARGASFFYGAITLGRFLSGFLAMRFPSRALIRVGQIICVFGGGLLMLPLPPAIALAAIILVGLGTAPIFPGMLHETPHRFGPAASQAVMGLQMAFAYVGSTCFPPLFGTLASWTGVGLLPYFVMTCAVIMLVASERLQWKLGPRAGV
ncbi:MAG: MFS transporter [Opitutaceae bacterium]